MKEGHQIDSPSRGQGSPAPSGLRGKSAAAPSPLPASVTAVNQSSSFSKQVSSATGCLGSARTAQSAGRSREHSGSMTRLGLLQRHCQGQTPPALATGSPHARPGPRTLTSAQVTTIFRRKLQVAGMDVKPQLRWDGRPSRASRALHSGGGDGRESKGQHEA